MTPLNVRRKIILLLTGITALLGIVLGVRKYAGMPAPDFVLPAGGQPGVLGPLILDFQQAVAKEKVEPYLSVEPEVPGTWLWEFNRAVFWPAAALQPGQVYSVRLQRGASDSFGRTLKDSMSWPFTPRTASILYLGEAANSPEIWLSDGVQSQPVVLTDTDGRVLDFAPYPGGEHIVYSVQNEQGGADLWVIHRDGSGAQRLLDCGADACLQPAVAPDETVITFSRRTSIAPLGEIWMFDLTSGKSEPLYADRTIAGIQPNWSPRGHSLQFYDPEFSEIRVLDLHDDRVILIPTDQQAIGSWSRDEQTLLFTRAESSEIGLPIVRIYQADLGSGEISLLEAADLGAVDASRPIFSPDGQSLVMALRPLAGAQNKQLWLVQADGSGASPITDDPRASFAAYAWDPAGNRLVFQRLQLESSQSRPQVMLWNQIDGSISIVAEDGAWPQWLP
ncbi:MAG: hypothetical protein GYA20_03350 [Chloroflexi bacterium]|nr:hypothetical protein [Chloroflexota bacterium]